MSFRKSGGISFGHIQSNGQRLQFALRKNIIGAERYSQFVKQIKIGVHVGVTGKRWTTTTGEPTVSVEDFTLLQDVWKPFPDKFSGIQSVEEQRRKRHLDCTMDQNTFNDFKLRMKTVSHVRRFLEGHDFLEVETPILQATASGAMATPFVTKHNALDAELHMRIAPETFLKRTVAAGFDRVFEIGKNFRNEGIDPSHLQEFTVVEWYAAYFHANDNLKLYLSLLDDLSVLFPKKQDFFASPTIRTYEELFVQFTGSSWKDFEQSSLDKIFKEKVRPNLHGSWIVTDYPAVMAPMAERKQNDDLIADMWQHIYNTWEVAKCYTELTNPILQRELLEEQAAQKANSSTSNDEDTMLLEEDFIECMEYGMPPMSGLGIGIDRLICILLDKQNLKDVVLFPLMLSRGAHLRSTPTSVGRTAGAVRRWPRTFA